MERGRRVAVVSNKFRCQEGDPRLTRSVRAKPDVVLGLPVGGVLAGVAGCGGPVRAGGDGSSFITGREFPIGGGRTSGKDGRR